MSKAKPAPTDRGTYARSENTRARILDAALTESERVGFHKVSMANIAARAEVAVGVLNYHFGSRQEMLHEIMAAQVQDFLSRLSAPEPDEGFFEYEAAILGIYLKFLRDNPNYVRLGEEVRLHDPEMYQRGTAIHVSHIVARIQRGIDSGELRAMAADEMRTHAYFMLGTYTFLDRLIGDDGYPGDDFVVAMYMSSLRASFCNTHNAE